MSVLLCTAFLQKLHCARVSHGMAQFIVLKIAHLSIYSQFQEGTTMTKENLFMFLKGNFRCQFDFAQRSCKNYIALVCHTGWRNLY